MEQPLDGMNSPSEVGQRLIDRPEHPPQGVAYASEVNTEMVRGSGQLKRGRIRHFEVFCDEAARIGGDDKYPSPMNYVAMGTGFWLLTQVARYAHMMKISVTHASVRVRYRLMVGGSVLKGTVFCNVEGVDTHLSVESDAPPDKLVHLIRNAKNGCFAESMIKQSVPLESTIDVNGKPLSIAGITRD